MAKVGFVAGYLPLPDRLRVIEYLRMFGRLYGLRRPDEAANAWLEHFGVAHLARATLRAISSRCFGVRAALAAAAPFLAFAAIISRISRRAATSAVFGRA